MPPFAFNSSIAISAPRKVLSPVSLDNEPIKPTLMSATAVEANITDAKVATTFISFNFIKSSFVYCIQTI